MATPVPWLEPTAGRHAFLGDDGGNATKQTVCASADEFRDWVSSNGNAGCRKYARGTPVIIDTFVLDPRKDRVGDVLEPLVKLHAADGAFKGFTDLNALKPVVPIGTVVDFAAVGNEAGVRLVASQNAGINDGVNLGKEVHARLLRFAPSADYYNVYVEVTDGPFHGNHGWLASMDASSGLTFDKSFIEIAAAAPSPALSPSEDASDAMVDGATARVNSKGDGMACFLTEKAMNDFVDSSVNKDRYGATEALQAAVFLQQDMRVRAIQHKGFLFDKMRIRLESGDDAGTACWVPSDAGYFMDVQNP